MVTGFHWGSGKVIQVTEIRQPLKPIPCDHQPPCGWEHYAVDGSPKTVERMEYGEVK